MTYQRFYRSVKSIVLIALCLCTSLNAQQTVGLFQNDPGSFDGYTLFNSLRNNTTYLMNNQGLQIRSWQSNYVVGNSVYLLEDGTLLRTADPGGNPVFIAGGDAGLIERYDWDGNLIWSYLYSNSTVRHHHDIAPMPNGNILILAWELMTFDEAVQAGRDPNLISSGAVWPEHVIELEPTGTNGGNIVWEWHLKDHLIQDFDPTKDNYGVVAEHPELLNINYAIGPGADWIHANAIDYNPVLDQILINSPYLGEFWIIDHSTTTAEAAGHTGGNSGMGGDILYRWGNPEAYDAGSAADRKFYNHHDVEWIAEGLPGAGNLLIFNNGQGRPEGAYSSIEEMTTTVDSNGMYPQPAPGVAHGPAEVNWIYTADTPTDFYSRFISGSQRLPNGNTLICSGANGVFFEIDSAGNQFWRYVNPVINTGPVVQGTPLTSGENATFRVTRFAPDYPAFSGRDLTPGDPIEIYPTGIADNTGAEIRSFQLAQNYPNPFNPSTVIRFSVSGTQQIQLDIYNNAGQKVAALASGVYYTGDYAVDWQAENMAAGIYYYRLSTTNGSVTKKMLLVK